MQLAFLYEMELILADLFETEFVGRGMVAIRKSGCASICIQTRNGLPAAAFRAIIYAPGCAIGTVVLTPSNSEVPSYSFDCRPLPDIAIADTLRRPDPLYGRNFKVQAK